MYRWLPAFALTIGPCASWLVWALQNRRWGHAAVASVANLILWTGGPSFLIYAERLTQ